MNTQLSLRAVCFVTSPPITGFLVSPGQRVDCGKGQTLFRQPSIMSDTSPQTSPGDDLEVIYEWNAVVQPAVEECFHHVFESWVEQIPNDEAIRARDDSLTYRELDKYASKLAYRLLEHGIRAESLVPICFEQSMWAIVSMLAILKAGGAIVPITASPRQRTEMLLKQMDSPGIILASAQQVTALTELSSDVWVVSREELDSINPVGSETLVIKADVRPDNLAFVIFTSGSTGPPKVRASQRE